MKRILLTLAIVTTFGFSVNAQRDAFFTWNDANNETYRIGETPEFSLPTAHGADNDSTAPLGSGLIILGALGAGYAMKKKFRV